MEPPHAPEIPQITQLTVCRCEVWSTLTPGDRAWRDVRNAAEVALLRLGRKGERCEPSTHVRRHFLDVDPVLVRAARARREIDGLLKHVEGSVRIRVRAPPKKTTHARPELPYSDSWTLR